MARWYPEADDGAWIDVPVFAQTDKAPQVSEPLIRVPAGTTIELTVEIRLDSTITVYGLLTRPAASLDSTVIAPRALRTFRFAAGAPHVLFGGSFFAGNPTNWDVAPDGRKFVMVRTPNGATEGGSLNLVLHWFDQLRAQRT